MIIRRELHHSTIIIALLLSPSLVVAASSQSFCKCICGGNSTIIPLDGTPLDAPSLNHGGAVPEADLLLPPDIVEGNDDFVDVNGGDPFADHQNYDPVDPGYHIPGSDDGGDFNAVPHPHRAAHAIKGKRQDFIDSLIAGEATSTSISSGASSTATAESAEDSEDGDGDEAEEEEGSAGNSTETQLVTPKRAGTCNDCNRQFCLDHPDFDTMCGEAREEEVFTTCFQRDSAKDQLVVYTFIVVTVGLLLYAAVRPYLERKYSAARERQSYSAVPSTGVVGG